MNLTTIPRHGFTIVVTSIALVIGSCSGGVDFSVGGQSVEDAAVELIEGDLAELIGLGALSATCPEVTDPAVGVTFECTATTEDGGTIAFAGEVDREDHIDVTTTNVVVADAVPAIEAAGVDVVNDQQGLALDASAMDCGDVAIVLDEAGTALCTLTDPDSGEVFDVTYTIADLEVGDFTLDVSPQG